MMINSNCKGAAAKRLKLHTLGIAKQLSNLALELNGSRHASNNELIVNSFMIIIVVIYNDIQKTHFLIVESPIIFWYW